jgi:hypothetical protein
MGLKQNAESLLVRGRNHTGHEAIQQDCMTTSSLMSDPHRRMKDKLSVIIKGVLEIRLL